MVTSAPPLISYGLEAVGNEVDQPARFEMGLTIEAPPCDFRL